MSREWINSAVLILLVATISALFLTMTRNYLMPIFLAALFSALVTPLYNNINRATGGRSSLSALVTVLLLIVLIVVPLAGLLGVFVNQAVNVSQAVAPWIEKFISEPSSMSHYLQKMPFYEELLPYRDEILSKAGQMVGNVSSFLVSGISGFTKGALETIFLSFIMFYAMYFFLKDGRRLLYKILYYMPLEHEDEEMLVERFTSVSRATIKGTVLIGLIQGFVCGIGYAFVGMENPVFWAIITAFSSVIPAVGTALIWVPATLIQAASGEWGGVIILLIVCGLIGGNLDNFLRPALVGKDTQMPDLMILISTLGGIGMFGMIGVVIGPIVAALFITIWDIYGVSFRQYLPEVYMPEINEAAVKRVTAAEERQSGTESKPRANPAQKD